MITTRWLRIAALLVAACPAPTSFAASQEQAKASLPALDREWTGPDYARAIKAVTSGDVPLPRLSDERGAALLGRITSTDNLSFHRNASLPLQSRLPDLMQLQFATNELLKVYISAANEKQEEVHGELARLFAFTLKCSEVGVELLEEFIPTIPKDDSYATRMDGLKRMKQGLTTQFVGAERSLTERDFYTPEDLSLLLDAMASTLPVLKRAFTPEYPAELRERLESHRPSFLAEADRKNLDLMLKELAP